MVDKIAIWKGVLGDLADDILDLFLSVEQPFPDNVNYPVTPGMEALVNDRFASLVLPEKRLLHLVESGGANWMEDYDRTLADWVALFEWEILKGFGDEAIFASEGALFEALMQLAGTWGAHLAQMMGRILRMGEMYEVAGDMLASLFRQLPARELGESIRESLTPGYLRAHAQVKYVWGLSSGDRTAMREAEEVLQASDADLSRRIDSALSGMSTIDMGTYMKQQVAEIVNFWGELPSSEDFKQEIIDTVPFAFQGVAGYMGYCFRQHLRNDPPRAKRVLEAIGLRKEVGAVVEEYRWMHGWGGDRNKAVELSWQSVARKYFRLNLNIENITEDEDQEKLIGVAYALEGYCDRNPAMVGIMDGVSGGVGAYLATAGRNNAMSWHRQEGSMGNRVLTEAEHSQAEDIAGKTRSVAQKEGMELSDDDILSCLNERYHPSGDPVVHEVERGERVTDWYGTLTDREKIAFLEKYRGYKQREIAREMGISQQRVSQLIKQAKEKGKKL